MSDVRLLQKSTYTYMKALPAYRAKIRSLYVQSVEHAAVNRRVVGSSPTGGAKKKRHEKSCLFFLLSLFGFIQSSCVSIGRMRLLSASPALSLLPQAAARQEKTAETGRDGGEDDSATMFQGEWSLVRAQHGEPNTYMSLNCNSGWGSYLFVGKCDISVFNISSTM